ncbi:MAG TPA: cytochrome c oxidase assembly protein [Gaiellales bacterium]|nr:cytochrome c oxidase assembly protein [Gaiellales bacterium]
MPPLLAAHDVPASAIAGAWHLHLAPVLFALVATAAFAPAFARVRRRDPARAPWSRAGIFACGLAVMVVPLVSPLNVAGERYLLSAHMLEHVFLADAGAALLVLSVRGPISRSLLPWPVPAPLPAIGAFLLRPAVTLALWAAVVAAWHIPAVYDRALTHPALHAVEHLSFVLAGLLAWTQLIDPTGSGRLGITGRLAFTVAMFFAGQLLSDALVFSFHAYYPAYADRPGRLFGISPLTDQRLAGIVMAAEQLLTLGTCFVVLLLQLRRSHATATLTTT